MPPDAVTAEQPAVTNGTDFGLSADEQAAYDAMRAEPSPAGDVGFEAPKEPDPDPAPTQTDPAEAPAQATTPADADDDDDGDDPGAPKEGEAAQPPQKRVGWTKYAKLQDELKAEKAARETDRAEKQAMAEKQARLDERLRLINEALTPPAGAQQQQQDEDPEPDRETDIFAHNAWLSRQNQRLREEFNEFRTGLETTRQAETTEQQIASTYMDDAQRFAATEPNFGPAYSYLMQVRTAQLANFHFGKDLTDPATPPLTAQEVNKIKSEVAREEKTLVSQAIKSGKSPAAAVYSMARMTGYRPQAAQAATDTHAVTNGAQAPAGNAAAPAATNGAPKPSVRAEIDRIKAGQDASLSLSHGGGAPAPVLNAAKLADMPDDEFGQLLENMSRGELRRVMGG